MFKTALEGSMLKPRSGQKLCQDSLTAVILSLRCEMMRNGSTVFVSWRVGSDKRPLIFHQVHTD